MTKSLMPKLPHLIIVKKKNNGIEDDPQLSNLYNLVISLMIPVANACLEYFKSLSTTW